MNLNYPALKLLYISILIVNIKSYIVIPLKSTDDLYFSKLSKKDITINNKDIINEIFHKCIFNVLYTDLIIGEPNQKSTAFILQDNFGFYFYEEFSTKELKELGYDNYNFYLKNKSKSIIRSDELSYNQSFWTYLNYEEDLYLYKFNNNKILNIEKFEEEKLSKTEEKIHFIYSIRNSSKIPNETDFINMEKKFQKEKEELRKLNFTNFSYFSIGLNFITRRSYHITTSFIDEFYSKKEISNKEWSIYYINSNKSFLKNNANNYNSFLIIGSSPHIYFSNIFKEVQKFSTYSEKYSWSNAPTLTFYDIYSKINETNVQLVNYDKRVELDFNFGLIKATWYTKTILDRIYFTNLINQGKCFESQLNMTEYTYYIYYYCDKNKITKEDINSFPGVNFHHNEFSYIFELNAEDLFETYGNIIIFKIVFDTSSYWVLGKLFLTKYFLSYDDDNKKIYFYNKNYGENDNNDINTNDNDKNKYFIIQLILIICGVIIFTILGFFIGKFIYNKRKVSTQELSDIENDDNLINKENIDTNDDGNKLIP